jgi:hypothetical protein
LWLCVVVAVVVADAAVVVDKVVAAVVVFDKLHIVVMFVRFTFLSSVINSIYLKQLVLLY